MDSNTAFTNEIIPLISKRFDVKNYKDDRSKDLDAVKKDGWAIKDIKDPTPEMCLEAVKNYGLAINYIKDPTTKLLIEAFLKNN